VVIIIPYLFTSLTYRNNNVSQERTVTQDSTTEWIYTEYLYSALSGIQSAQTRSHSFTCKLHHACLCSQAFTRWRHH